MKDAKLIGVIATYTAGIFYGAYCSVKQQPFYDIGKIKWM
jgi:hypothetical protein